MPCACIGEYICVCSVDDDDNLFKNRPDGIPETKREGRMAQNITGQIVGGRAQVFNDVETVGDVAEKMGIKDRVAMVNGETATYDQILNDYEFVTFTDKKKGGA